MAKKTVTIDCPNCMDKSVVTGQNAELAAYCPICGDAVVRSYDDDEEDEDESDDLRRFDPDDEDE